MKRRVNRAIGIIHAPKILFLDEPTVGVDVQSKNAIIKYLQEINELGTTIIYTSHHMSEAEEFCKNIALIDHGKVIAGGELTTLKVTNEVPSLQSLFIKLTGEEYRD
jgi:ABC-2 type transport system ATP-binding protein